MGRILRRGAAAGFVVVCLLVSGPGCGGTDGGGNAPKPVDITARGRAVLGFLGGATVEVYDAADLSAPVGVGTTTNGPTHDEIGNFEVPLAGVLPSDLFLFVVYAGEAFDVDADGVIDPISTPHLGTVHGLASGAQLMAGSVNVSVVTEIAYQRSRYYLSAAYPAGYVAKTLDSWAGTLLAVSTDGDDDVDASDLVVFDPRTDRTHLLRVWPPFQTLREDILAGSDPAAAALALSAWEMYYADLSGSASDVDVVGTRAYVCRGALGLEIYDISNPEAPTLSGTYNSPGNASRVQVVGTLAYVADGSGGLQIVDVGNPALPVQAGAVSIPNAGKLVVVGNRAYVTEWGTLRLHVVDVSVPATASVMGSVGLQGTSVYDLAVSGNHAYTRLDDAIEVIDVSTPTAPASRGTVDTSGFYGAILARGSTLYVATDGAIEMFDLSTPAAPTAVGSRPLPQGGSSPNEVVDLGDGRLAVCMSFDGIGLVDVASPREPTWLGNIQVSGGVGHLAPG
ncbi:MAG: LVIVD repeat-containing protein, partial [Planctomycetota bacterium]